MELKIEQGQFNTDLYTEIAENLTIERLVDIYIREWNRVINDQVYQLKVEVFNKLSTPLKIKWLKIELNNEVLEQRKINQEVNDAYFRGLFIKYSENKKKQIEKQIFMLNPPPVPEGFITEADVIRAREVPISNFIEFKRKLALCLWHNDTKPSLYYYEKQNKVKCFACQVREDVIGVIQVLKGVDFIEAVKLLL